LDEQFAVLTRLTIVRVNEILIRIGGEEADFITYDEVNKMFMDWLKFRARNDCRKFMKEWYMGGDLSALPPEVKENDEAPTEGEDHGESSERVEGIKERLEQDARVG